MKTLLAVGVIATVLAASTAFAVETPSSQSIKGTEGPDVRLTQAGHSMQTVKGTEGPDVR